MRQEREDVTLWPKPKSPTLNNIRRNRLSPGQRLNRIFYREGELRQGRKVRKVPLVAFGLAFLATISAISALVLYSNYKTTSFELSPLIYMDSSKVSSDIKEYLEQRAFFKINQNEFATYLKEKNPLVDDVYISKSFLKGMVVEIKEKEPIAVVDVVDDRKFFYTKKGEFIEYYDIPKIVIVLRFDGKLYSNSSIDDLIKKSVLFVNQLSSVKLMGAYTFDNFGNFSILTLDRKLIKLDLKERYFTMDQQIQVLRGPEVQNILKNPQPKVVDLRFNYLVIRDQN